MSEQRFARRALPAMLAVLFAGGAHAAGFQLQNQNGAGTSTAFSGGAAAAEDASTIWFNPAGMTMLPMGHNVTGAATILHRTLEFSDRGSTPLVTALGASPLGANGGDAGGVSLIPAVYWAYAINQQLRVGVGVSAPFGNKTEWDSNFIGRFQGVFSEIKTINLNPSIAYQVTPALSLGLGINYQKIEADLQGLVPTVAGERTSRLEGDDTAWGYNLGVLWQVSPSTRVGFSYRSTTDYTVEGTVTSPIPATGGSIAVPVRADVELPDMASLSVFQKLSDKWDMMGDISWTGWSSLPALTVRSAASGAVLQNENLDFEDSWKIALGGQYHYTDALKLRFGVAYDKTPIPDADSRTVRLPDSDRYWLSFGARYFFSPKTSLDVGYTHIFLDDDNIDRRTVLGTTPTGQFVRGEFEASVNILSFQLNHNF